MKNTVRQDTPALAFDNVKKIYTQWQRSGRLRDIAKNLLRPEKREAVALGGVTFSVDQGDFVAYAGPNGAGKSTTVKILSGILRPTSGAVSVLGMDPAKERVRLMENIGVLFGQRTELWWDHPVVTSYEWKKCVWNIPEETYRRNLAMVTELLDLSGLLNTFARELSLGQRMRADLGMLLLHSPKVLFLDEPTLGLDVLAKRQMIRFLKKLNAESGTTIVVTSHDMDDLEEMARRIILLSAGKIAFDGSFDGLRKAQGALSRISVSLDGSAPELPGLTLVSSRGGVHEYEFDSERTGIRDILEMLSRLPGVTDMEIGKAPIEQVISNLYLQWKT